MDEFKKELLALCRKHNVSMEPGNGIYIEVYRPDAGLMADFDMRTNKDGAYYRDWHDFHAGMTR